MYGLWRLYEVIDTICCACTRLVLDVSWAFKSGGRTVRSHPLCGVASNDNEAAFDILELLPVVSSCDYFRHDDLFFWDQVCPIK